MNRREYIEYRRYKIWEASLRSMLRSTEDGDNDWEDKEETYEKETYGEETYEEEDSFSLEY